MGDTDNIKRVANEYHCFRLHGRLAGWPSFAAEVRRIIEWCESTIGDRRYVKGWAIIDIDGKIVPKNQSYSVHTIYAICIKDPELAVFFRLKFNLTTAYEQYRV